MRSGCVVSSSGSVVGSEQAAKGSQAGWGKFGVVGWHQTCAGLHEVPSVRLSACTNTRPLCPRIWPDAKSVGTRFSQRLFACRKSSCITEQQMQRSFAIVVQLLEMLVEVQVQSVLGHWVVKVYFCHNRTCFSAHSKLYKFTPAPNLLQALEPKSLTISTLRHTNFVQDTEDEINSKSVEEVQTSFEEEPATSKFSQPSKRVGVVTEPMPPSNLCGVADVCCTSCKRSKM